MNTSFKARLLQHVLKAKQNKSGGFTLIELLVVIIIIGILAAIALPSFLNQANKARQTEAKTYVGSMNRAQQAFFLEQNSFTTNIPELALGIDTDTENYDYLISSLATDANGNIVTAANIGASNNQATLKDYVGGVDVGTVTGADDGEATTLAVLCEESGAPSDDFSPSSAASTAGDVALDVTNANDIECDETAGVNGIN